MTLIPVVASGQALVFLGLAGWHGYWALGGTVGLAGSLPAQVDGTVLFQPAAGAVWAVAAGLLVPVALGAAYLRPGTSPGWVSAGEGVLAAGLLLRAVGDFRYVGLTKRVQHTTFARRDTRYYTPLCLLLAGAAAALALAG